MPTLRGNTVFQVARNLKAFLSLEAGLTRGEVPRPPFRGRGYREDPAPAGAPSANGSGLRPRNIVWIFCTGRSGSTWLSNMMAAVGGHEVWKEPRIGQLFGDFYYVHSVEKQRRAKKFIMGQGREEVWLGSLRSMVLEGARSMFPGMTEEGYLVVKEPGGATGAPLIMRALPESRMVLLVRDPRDVAASTLDGVREGGWIYNWRDATDAERDRVAGDLLAFAKETATSYVQQIGNAKRAYEAHTGPKTLVRYEDLLEDTLGELERLYSELGIAVDRRELAEIVGKHAWDNVPEEKKGEGKFYRKASPGAWKEDLTPEQAEAVGEIAAPLIKEFYS